MSGLMEQATLWAAMLNGSPDEQENSEGEILDMLLARITALEAREAELVARVAELQLVNKALRMQRDSARALIERKPDDR